MRLCHLTLGLSFACLMVACGNPWEGRSSLFGDDEAPRAYAATDIVMALDPSTSVDAPILLVGVPEDVKDVYYCESATANECSSTAPGYTLTKLLVKKGGRAIYRAQSALAPKHNMTLAVTALEANDQRSTRLVRIEAAGTVSPPISDINLGDPPTTYLSITAVRGELQRWAQAEPRLMQFSKYADVNGQPATYLRVSKGVSEPGERPKILITAATHGDEKISTATILGFMHKFISAYGKDPKVTQLVDSRDVYFVPVACPDGYASNSRYVQGRIDPNRSFISPVNPDRTPSRCAGALSEFFLKEKFNATIDYHAMGRLMMYPWSYTGSPIADGDFDRKYRAIASKMAQQSGYRWGQIPTIIGYAAEGSSGDFFHWQGRKNGFDTFAMAVEVGDMQRGKAPDPRYIGPEVDANYQALMTFIDEAPLQFKASASAGYGLTDALDAPAAPTLEDFADLHAAGFLE